jgi:hypothetical protein
MFVVELRAGLFGGSGIDVPPCTSDGVPPYKNHTNAHRHALVGSAPHCQNCPLTAMEMAIASDCAIFLIRLPKSSTLLPKSFRGTVSNCKCAILPGSARVPRIATTSASAGQDMHEASVGCSELAAMLDPKCREKSRLPKTQSCFASHGCAAAGSLFGTLFTSVQNCLIALCIPDVSRCMPW